VEISARTSTPPILATENEQEEKETLNWKQAGTDNSRIIDVFETARKKSEYARFASLKPPGRYKNKAKNNVQIARGRGKVYERRSCFVG